MFKRIAGVSLLFVLVTCCAHIHGATSSQTPTEAIVQNVLLLILDDLKPSLGSFGDDRAITPHIDELSRRGVRFPLTYAQLASCGPSRSSMLTSRRIDALGSYVNNFDVRSKHEGIQTIFQVFKSEGYHVSGAGKVFDSRSFGDQDMPLSWSEQFAFTQNDTTCFDRERSECPSEVGCKCVLFADPSVVTSSGSMPAIERPDGSGDDLHIDGRMTDYALVKLREWAEQGIGKPAANSSTFTPFIFALGFKKPHLPWTAPREYFELYDNQTVFPAEFQSNAAGASSLSVHQSPELNSYYGFSKSDAQDQVNGVKAYLATVSYMDNLIGKVVHEIDALGYGENTAIVLLGDHGFHLGDHGLWTKHSTFENAVRTPLIVALPQKRSAEWDPYEHCGSIVPSPIELLDLAPTLLDIVGLLSNTSDTDSPAKGFVRDAHGKSFRPLLTEKLEVLNETSLSIGYSRTKTVAMSQFLRVSNRMGYTFRTQRYRYVRWVRRSNSTPLGTVVAEELYDYLQDPLETTNFKSSDAYVLVLAEFRKYWDEYELVLSNNFEQRLFTSGPGFDVESARDTLTISTIPVYAPLQSSSPTQTPTSNPTVSPLLHPTHSPNRFPTESPNIAIGDIDGNIETDDRVENTTSSTNSTTSVGSRIDGTCYFYSMLFLLWLALD